MKTKKETQKLPGASVYGVCSQHTTEQHGNDRVIYLYTSYILRINKAILSGKIEL